MSLLRRGVNSSTRFATFATVLCLLYMGCKPNLASSKASVEITKVPVANAGGPQEMDFIEGRAINAKPGQQIVLYARSGIWWVQPFGTHPYTKIQPDSTWKNSTHLGREYAAILVDSDFHAPTKLADLPVKGNGVSAVATSQGRSAAPISSTIIHFSGYDWTARSAGSDRGGQSNRYDPSNAWTDANGFLHLRMQEHNGELTCAEVSLTRSLGYGTYAFVVKDIGFLNPSAVFGMYTVDDFRIDNVRSELDVEISRWGISGSKNAQYVTQPFYVPENLFRFSAPSGELTHTVHWEAGRASFRTIRGVANSSKAPAVSEHVFTSRIPTPAKETAHIGLYSYMGSKELRLQPVEVVIERFQFLP